MESLPLAFSSGWASGVNAYLVVLVLGVADRISDRSDIPDVLARWDVLAIAGFLYAMEFVADKIPYVDSTWDVVSTAIRPTAGAVIGALLAGQVPEDARLDQVALAAVGGGTALVSHLTKTGLRLAVNTSPEPVTNIGVSLAEDLAVLGVVAVAVQHPRIAAAVAAVLLVAGLLLLFLAIRLVRRGWRRWQARRERRAAGTAR
ncbi:DUF4126 domain-containing protein [Nocardioides anomalus]|uniref:DUF4126 domain-containing protein n=1 Tax=Nocardioides anomalus TaxID=2712223 RepID=A0A6G6WBG2_9ACTN|nr:DUF4126 domain-containing protein [Nocardioides anomalus]QIG42572.1 DUF4126 domain-containing protein [Nocardioides anomalus]